MDNELENMLACCVASCTGLASGMAKYLSDVYTKYGKLNQEQMDILEKIYNRLTIDRRPDERDVERTAR